MVDKWKMFKNYMHNELGITKEDIREWVKEAVYEVAKMHVENNISEGLFKRIIRGYIENGYGFLKTELKSAIASEFASNFEIDVKLKKDKK